MLYINRPKFLYIRTSTSTRVNKVETRCQKLPSVYVPERNLCVVAADGRESQPPFLVSDELSIVRPIPDGMVHGHAPLARPCPRGM